jgi:signal transduction histidine kinase
MRESREAVPASGAAFPEDVQKSSPPSTLAPVLIIALLISLAIVPILIQIRIRALRTEIAEVADPARALVTELQLRLAMEGVGARGFMLTGQDSYAAVYYVAQRERSHAYAQLLPLTRQLGPSLEADALELGPIFHEADSLLAEVMSGQVPVDRFLERLPERQAAFTRATATVALLDRAIGEKMTTQRQAIRSTERIGVFLTSVLVLLALAAAVAAVRFMAERRRAAEERESLLEAERSARAVIEKGKVEAEQRREELERVTASRAELMRGFSHDVKNPLGAADGYLELLEEGIIGPVTAKQKESLGRARRSIATALRLIGDLLELARAEAIEIEREAVDLQELVRELVEENRARAGAKNLELSAEMSIDSEEVRTDATRVRQIVGNLLSNAIKYTLRGGVSVRVAMRNEKRRGRDGRWAAIDVTDTGPGIAADQEGLLFREFHRLDSAAGTDGAGIGLAISRRLAHALGGDLTIDSELGRGSTFTLWLPAA